MLDGSAAQSGDPALGKAPPPHRCTEFVRKQVARALPEICRGLLGKALRGDLQALKAVWSMALLDKPATAASRKPKPERGEDADARGGEALLLEALREFGEGEQE